MKCRTWSLRADCISHFRLPTRPIGKPYKPAGFLIREPCRVPLFGVWAARRLGNSKATLSQVERDDWGLTEKTRWAGTIAPVVWHLFVLVLPTFSAQSLITQGPWVVNLTPARVLECNNPNIDTRGPKYYTDDDALWPNIIKAFWGVARYPNEA